MHLDRSNYHGYFRSKLLAGGYLLTQYQNTGTMLLSHIEHPDQLCRIGNPSKVMSLSIFLPLIITIHDDDVLQIFNVETGNCDRWNQGKDQIRSTQFMVFNQPISKIWCFLPEKLVMYDQILDDLRPDPNAILPANTAERMPADLSTLPSIVIPLIDPSKPNHRKVVSLKESYSYLMSETDVLLGSTEFIQVWRIFEGKAHLLFQADLINNSFLNISWYRNTILGTHANNTVTMWDWEDRGPTAKPAVILMDGTSVATAVFMDDNFLIIGDSRGVVSLRERKTANLLYVLNNPYFGEEVRAPHGVSPPDSRHSTLSRQTYTNRINCIQRVGRWVFVGTEQSSLLIYDLHKQKVDTPAAEYKHPKGGGIKMIMIEDNTIYMAIRIPPSKQSPSPKPLIVSWTPRLEGFDFFSVLQDIINNKNVTSHAVALYFSHTKISNMVRDVAIMRSREDMTEFNASLQAISQVIKVLVTYGNDIKVPFLLIADLQRILDKYENLLCRLDRSGKLMSYFTNTRLRKGLEQNNTMLYQKVNEIKSILMAMVHAEKKRRAEKVAHSQPLPTSPPNHVTSPSQAPRKSTLPISISTSTSTSTSSWVKPKLPSQPSPILSRHNSVPELSELPENRPSTAVVSPTYRPPAKTTIGNFPNRPHSERSPSALISPNALLSPNSQRNSTKLGFNEDEDGRVTIYFGLPPDLKNPNSQVENNFQDESARLDALSLEEAPRSHIEDPEGRHIWESNFSDSFIVEWPQLYFKLKPYLGEQVTRGDQKIIQHVLDNSSTGFVSQTKFSEFLKGFGPLSECIQNLKSVLAEPWFQGYLTNREADLLLRNEPEGSYLIRFSKSKPGSFALAFKSKTIVQHILIQSMKPKPYQIPENNSRSVREFPTLNDIIRHYHYVLKYPFTSSLPREKWFQGDISGEEAAEMLQNEEVGSYMIRFSTSGDLAASWIDQNGSVKHCLIQRDTTGIFKMKSGEREIVCYNSVKELVQHLTDQKIFTKPYKNLSSIFKEDRKTREGKERPVEYGSVVIQSR
eukprot:TRINITY_DN3784_c0_g2_i3.p1 TRINITY_DN3784_c0_g2~~TRINITY_DN3784_c0_g2_i3.p1  ORF type:complete len:1027 (+),score=315.72 TRINITY_DN3784_c0_g2_i3:409-3489(+)